MSGEWVANTGYPPNVSKGTWIDIMFNDGYEMACDESELWEWGSGSSLMSWRLHCAESVKSQETTSKCLGKRVLKVVGVTGKAGSGKDTVADYLVQEYGFTKVSFASILKNMLKVAGLPEPTNREDKEKLIEGFDFSWRDAAQKLGTEWGRSLDENIWVKLTTASLGEAKYVFSDVRFDNEASEIRKQGGAIIHLQDRGVDMGKLMEHASERGVARRSTDYEISNSKDKKALYSTIDIMLSHYGPI
jgi:hypothetical protein